MVQPLRAIGLAAIVGREVWWVEIWFGADRTTIVWFRFGLRQARRSVSTKPEDLAYAGYPEATQT
jgi:hypothetical protein